MAGWAGNDPAPIPQWAMAEAQRRLEDADNRDGGAHGNVAVWIVRLIADHIAQHEQPPVDPVRELIDEYKRHVGDHRLAPTGAEEGRLQFARWLFETGRIVDRKHKEAGE